MRGHSEAKRSQYVGEVAQIVDGWAQIEVKNHFEVGDQIEIIHPSGNRILPLQHMQDLNGQPINVAAGSPAQVKIPLAESYSGALLAKLL